MHHMIQSTTLSHTKKQEQVVFIGSPSTSASSASKWVMLYSQAVCSHISHLLIQQLVILIGILPFPMTIWVIFRYTARKQWPQTEILRAKFPITAQGKMMFVIDWFMQVIGIAFTTVDSILEGYLWRFKWIFRKKQFTYWVIKIRFKKWIQLKGISSDTMFHRIYHWIAQFGNLYISKKLL